MVHEVVVEAIKRVKRESVVGVVAALTNDFRVAPSLISTMGMEEEDDVMMALKAVPRLLKDHQVSYIQQN